MMQHEENYVVSGIEPESTHHYLVLNNWLVFYYELCNILKCNFWAACQKPAIEEIEKHFLFKHSVCELGL